MDGEDDAGLALRKTGLLTQPVLQGVADEVAEFGKTLGFFAKDVAQNSGDGKHPVPVRDGQADFVANVNGGIERTALVATGAATAPLAGEGQQVMVVAVGALNSEEAVARSPQRRLSRRAFSREGSSGPRCLERFG